MATDAMIEEELGENRKGKGKGGARRERRTLAPEVWSKTERMNCERALLSFGLGRWGRVINAAGGGTRMRSEDDVALFGVAFVCLCVGVPIGSVGAAAPSAAESEGVSKARELLASLGCATPTLTAQQIAELEPLVTAGGPEYAERVHKLGASFLARLLAIKRLADSIERTVDPLATYVAPPVRGGVGRTPGVRWTARDDALLLLGVYKHGCRAYEEVRDDPELHFSCQLGGWALPTPLDRGFDGTSVIGYDELDELPLPRAGARRRAADGGSAEKQPTAGPIFPQKKEFDERLKALMDAVQEAERERDVRLMWEEEWEAEAEAEAEAAPAKRLRVSL